MRKNPNGYGTVYKLSGNRRRPYIARRTVGWVDKPDGTKKQQYQTIGYYASRSEAMKALNDYWRCGIVQTEDMTLADVYNEWSKVHYPNIEPKTAENYIYAYKLMQPYHSVRFIDLRTAHWQQLINDNAGFAKSTLKKLKSVGSMLYAYAIDNDICAKNYMTNVNLPHEDKREKEIFANPDIQLLWDNINKPYINYILFLVYTGLRGIELRKLTVFDIDLDNMMIRGGAKTDAGKNRLIPIHPDIQQLTRDLVADAKRGNGKIYKYCYSTFLKHYTKALKELNVKYIPPHNCRHTFASAMVRAGANPAVLTRIIGHKDYATTVNTYTHLDRDALTAEMKKIGLPPVRK